jgi:molybdate transport system substrate-binding protein
VDRRYRIASSAALAAVVLAAVVAGCGGDSGARAVHVFAAASLSGAFAEIATAFEAEHADVDVVTNFAGSSALVTQIVEGAPADVFAAADTITMERLADGDGIAAEPRVFATNRVELVVAPGNPLGIDGLAALGDPALIVVTCAPVVPCGAYATEAFARAGVTVQPDSLEENPGAVLTKVVAGEADAGIVYATDARAAGDAVEGVPIPPEHNVTAEYPIAVTSAADDPELAEEFVTFVAGPAGQSILASYGFGAP